MGCSASSLGGTSRFSKRRAASYSEGGEGFNSNNRPASNSSSNNNSTNEANVDVGVMYASSGAHVWDSRPDTGNLVKMAMVDSAQTAGAVGGGVKAKNSAGGGISSLKEVMQAGREEAKRAQDRLGESMTTPLVRKEMEMMASNANWTEARKDVNVRYPALPPIATGKRVLPDRAMAFTVSMN